MSNNEENCDNNCGSCSKSCPDRTEEKHDFSAALNEYSEVRKVIGVVSGKGGVGKSSVTSLLATALRRQKQKVAILDADITGPSIPKAFGIEGRAEATDEGILPAKSATGIEIMSVNLLLEDSSDPVLWRGPLIGNAVKTFWTDVIWKDIDFMLIDMPPGTGDVALTVFQSLPVDGIIVVTSPQELVSMIVKKAVKMAEMMNIPILGLVENMSYFRCPDNGKDYKIFGESHIDEIASAHNLKVLAKLPIDPQISAACDNGEIEFTVKNLLEDLAKTIISQEKNMIKIAVASDNKSVTGHFGHCQTFEIYEAEDGKIVKSESLANPGHKPGFLPNYLHEKGVNVIISGGMGGGAVEIFNENGIEVIVGAKGESKAAAEAYLKGALQSTGSVCHEHQHEGSCGGH
ncbi:MAG: P-loop NTPase [Candidatus Ozemobacteraceae bacterium]|jgi:Mrp family chromosome partitioning ATPase/predicted Fe-Mo cluster-binding NifX family protein